MSWPFKHDYGRSKIHDTFQVIGFDSVDDESKNDTIRFCSTNATPENWTTEVNPAYSYYIYYIWSNMVVLNALRKLVYDTDITF